MQHLQMASRPDRQPGPVDAMMVDLVCLPKGGMVEVPAHLVDEQATLPCAALTAWSVVVSCDAKLKPAKALGADAASPIGRHRMGEAGARSPLTADRGFDNIVQLGGERTLPQPLRYIRPGRTLSMIGVLSGARLAAPLGLVVTRLGRLLGISVGCRNGFATMLRAINQHRLPPVIDRVFAFEERKAAMAYRKSGAHFGKVCIRY